MALSNNEFGDLVKAYRKQRGWTQDQLAEHWGHSRGYVSHVEAGKRRLDSASQVIRLADILDIPQEKLEAIGKGIPTRRIHPQSVEQADSAILQMLLAPGRDMVRLSWLAWFANSTPSIEENLQRLVLNLDQALTSYRGEFVKPAQQLLAYAHQMQGKMAFDHLNFAAASGHFSEMIDLGQELNDADIITLGMVHQGDILRKRGRLETSLRCFEASKAFADASAPEVQGIRHQTMARAYSVYGDEQRFLRSIDAAVDVASQTRETLENLANEFDLVECLQEKAQGLTMLWQPEKALEIYKETDKLRPFRPLRDQGSYAIVKAQAYTYAGDLTKGTKYALQGLQLASEYRSKRHIARLEGMYTRVRVTPLGKEKQLRTIQEALQETQRKQVEW